MAYPISPERRPAHLRRLRHLAQEMMVPVGLVAAFGLWSARAESFYFPSLTRIVERFSDVWLFDRVVPDLVPSVVRMISGYGIAVILGIATGLLCGCLPTLRVGVDPIVQFMRALPSAALIPFVILILGIGDAMKVTVIFTGALWPILLNTMDGAMSVDETMLDMAKTYHLPARARLRHVVLPAASPRILAGMRTSLSIAIVLMVVSEMVASTNGVGYFVLSSQRSFAIPDMWSGIIVLGILGYVANIAFVRVERQLLYWHRGANGLAVDDTSRKLQI